MDREKRQRMKDGESSSSGGNSNRAEVRAISDSEMLNWFEENCKKRVRGTDYPCWRIEGFQETSTLREAIRDNMQIVGDWGENAK